MHHPGGQGLIEGNSWDSQQRGSRFQVWTTTNLQLTTMSLKKSEYNVKSELWTIFGATYILHYSLYKLIFRHRHDMKEDWH